MFLHQKLRVYNLVGVVFINSMGSVRLRGRTIGCKLFLTIMTLGHFAFLFAQSHVRAILMTVFMTKILAHGRHLK